MADAEKGYTEPSGSSSDGRHADPATLSGIEGHKAPWTTRFVDSFRRDPNAAVLKSSGNAKGEYNSAAAAEATANTALSRQLKGRHMQMIAIGGSIGKFKV